MFEPTSSPRVCGLPPGADFATSFVAGLTARSNDLTGVRIFVNAPRMMRQIQAAFDKGPARLLPRIQPVTDLAFEGTLAGLAAPVSP
ncbi:MAG: hypothetical protein KKB02_04355, partial [Alphaproteobacteria bacterium]|nr:hypothetical protein [Alphaproteobacteria bacterium]